MCGFAGFIDVARAMDAAALARVASAMSERIAHRGPDDGQIWIDGEAGAALGFRRLAIQDLSDAGRQPMPSRSGRYVVLFNGEIYNAPELRAALVAAGVPFRGRCDTEVLVAEIDRRGIAAALPALRGMFALACWDRQERTLHLARDPIGKKPLYFGTAGPSFVFASQPKAFLAHPGFRTEADRDALAAFFRFGYVPAPLTIFRGIEKLRPGERIEVREGRVTVRERFWDCAAEAAAGMRGSYEGCDESAVGELERRIGDAVERRLVSDVPVGAFLSGGIDSATVVALMRVRCPFRVRSFCIGFDGAAYDESHHAQAVADHLGVEHRMLEARASDLRDAIAVMPEVYDEPFADPSQVPTYLLSRLAREHVTVALSGDGGDELFGGYTRYAVIEGIAGAVGRLPRAARVALAGALRTVPYAAWRAIEPAVPRAFGRSPLAARAARLADMLSADGAERSYKDIVGQWREVEGVVIGAREPDDPIWSGALRGATTDPLRLVQLIDLLTYLPENILVKVDRASMAVGLEVRAPLLDHEVVQFSWSLPRDRLVRGGTRKWLLRQVLYRHVPPALVDRPKMGFGFPLAELLRRDLRDWAESLLEPSRMQAAGYLDPRPIRAKWEAHRRGQADWSYNLWCALMFEAWLETFCRVRAAQPAAAA
jgi:asparagine synthase (glutamine-hydrolysing)